ncbi:MAG: hypothetical protein A2V88_08510 [Elusimicrobia bacterium RBG_16_66_12]|nr:MAG: hypothetical protein A2V88_08510 [Elusimicrobia bacterium RBG_16_66_12]
MSLTLQEAFDRFQAQANLSRGTLTVYAQAIEHFYEFLRAPSAARLSLVGDEPAQAAISWFRWMDDELLLPARFPATAAINNALRRLRTYIPASEARDGAPKPPEGIDRLVHAVDRLEIPGDLPAREHKRRELEALRNRALLYALADSGARVSEVLQLNADHVRGARVNRQGVWSVQVRGKRLVTLRFTRPTLQGMRAYPKARDDPGATALFVSHARTRPQYRGWPMSSMPCRG